MDQTETRTTATHEPDAWEPHRRRAEDALEAGEWAQADREYAELNRAGALTPGDARRWVSALEQCGAAHHDATTLRHVAEVFPEEDDVVEFVAGELWRRAEELSEKAGPVADLTMAQLAWGTALLLAPPLARSDDDALRMIGLLDRLYQASRTSAQPFGSFGEFEQALLAFAAAGPRATLRAADLLAAEDPGMALELVAGRDESAEAILVAAVASSELDDFARAATLFDHLAIRWGIRARDMDVEDRSRWIQAMTDVGRFEEAEEACCATLATLDDAGGSWDRWPAVGVTAGSVDHWRHTYRLLAYRLAMQRGRFREGWDHLRAAAQVGMDGQPTALQRSVLRVRLTFAGPAEAVTILEELARLAVVDPCDTTYAEACLWAWSRWGSARQLGDDNPLAGARFRGQAAARSILARADCPLSARQQLRVVLLAGDDDRAARMLELEPLEDSEPWTVQVLGAMLAMRRGDDVAAHQILGKVLPQRRHDVELRVLAAQSDLISGDYKAALKQAMSLTDGVPDHILARTIRAECEFESALAQAADVEGAKDSVENVQQLMSAVRHYRRVADLHRDTTAYLLTGVAREGAAIGSEPLAPRLHAEVCRRGMHAAILAQEGLARLGLRSDRALVMDARDLTHHLRSIDRECCERASATRGRRLAHQIRHLGDRDEAARLAMLMISYQKARWQRRAQNVAFFALGALVAWLALTDLLPGPSSDSIRVMMLGVGVLLLLMPFARSLKVGVVELSRDAPSAPLSGRSKSMRTSRLLLRTHHLGMFALPTPPDKGRRAHESARGGGRDGAGG